MDEPRPPGWIFLPALGAPLAHAPVLKWNLLTPLKRPISRRLFGANKTWRGAIVMTAGAIMASEALHRLPAYRRTLPPAIAATDPALTGALIGTAMWVGELPNSFVKRRLGIPPGGQRRSAAGVVISVVDQADWVPVACLLLRPIHPLTARQLVESCAVVAAVHVPINVLGYAIGARTAAI
jgi:hypothetical protein